MNLVKLVILMNLVKTMTVVKFLEIGIPMMKAKLVHGVKLVKK